MTPGERYTRLIVVLLVIAIAVAVYVVARDEYNDRSSTTQEAIYR
jgi:hypothetical protein